MVIERVARALCAYDVRLDPDEISDPVYEAKAAEHVEECWKNYVGDARTAIEALAANVTIEMGVALERALSEGDGGRDLGGGYKLRAISLALRAALSEGKGV